MERKKEELRKFSSLEEFVIGSNNFIYHFLEGNLISFKRREKYYYTRFKEVYPELEKRTTQEVCEYFEMYSTLSGIYKDLEKMNLLYESYNKMADLILKEVNQSYPRDLLIR